jgi:hypothetical protein
MCWPGFRTFTVRAKIWLYPGMAGWHFVSLPKKTAKTITDRFSDEKRGWGSLPVTVTIGHSTWKTSIFPDTKEGTYLLPLKAVVRKKEHIKANDSISITLEICTS